MRVAVIGGGASCEHDVSLASAAGVADAAERAGHEVVRLTIRRDGSWTSRRDEHAAGRACRDLSFPQAVAVLQSCDVVVPVVHGPRGEDGTLAALCDLAGVPNVGSGVGAGAIGMDKWATKLVAGALGIATARGELVSSLRLPVASYDWTGPVVVKPVAAGSSLGVSLVRRPEQLAPAIAAALELDDRVLVEELVVGREVDVAVLGRPDGSRTVAPPLEIAVDGVFDHATKYDGTARFLVPADLDPGEREELERAAVRVYDALGCRGVARVDFFLTDTGPVLNEVNTTPGFTEQSQVPRMFAAAGLSYVELVDLLVQDASCPSRHQRPLPRAGIAL